MAKVGITGTIGTGKSTVAKMFQELGAYLIDFDAIARLVVEPGQTAWKQIIDYFGRDILNADNTIDRQKLANVVFNSEDSLHKLNSITHPEIWMEDERLTTEMTAKDLDRLIIKEIPLFFETDPSIRTKAVDKIIVVFVTPKEQLQRLIRRGMDEKDARDRITAQKDIDVKIKLADYVVDNSGSIEETRAQVKKIYDILTRH